MPDKKNQKQKLRFIPYKLRKFTSLTSIAGRDSESLAEDPDEGIDKSNQTLTNSNSTIDGGDLTTFEGSSCSILDQMNQSTQPTQGPATNQVEIFNSLRIPDAIKDLPKFDGNQKLLYEFLNNVEEILLYIRGTDNTPYGQILLRAIRNKIEGQANEKQIAQLVTLEKGNRSHNIKTLTVKDTALVRFQNCDVSINGITYHDDTDAYWDQLHIPPLPNSNISVNSTIEILSLQKLEDFNFLTNNRISNLEITTTTVHSVTTTTTLVCTIVVITILIIVIKRKNTYKHHFPPPQPITPTTTSSLWPSLYLKGGGVTTPTLLSPPKPVTTPTLLSPPKPPRTLTY
ncbi:uncharacterized protein LOC131996010 [Stomoxys calcitrans]|uniref:uncharacterized protein LOC131996010 n=1 Tax=Stomoxys calcitrans TaxID=35570 RepID=UPI0027E330F3|nr:uncharacterized protein LOC131996010 [Stomoxys calcitrans]